MPGKRRPQRVTSPPPPKDILIPFSLRADGLALLALLAVYLTFFWRALFLRGFFVHSDILFFFEPIKSFLHDSLRAGRLPLWCPFIFAGYPLVAEGQVAAFYPPSLLFSLLLPSPAAINWLIISHLLLAGLGMYLFARHLNLAHFSAWLSAITFSFSGYLFAHTHHVSLICAAAWLPLLLYFADRAISDDFLLYGIATAVIWCAVALSGHPQTLFYTTLAFLFWLTCRALQQVQKRHALPRAAAVFALSLLLGIGLASVQLLLTADLSLLAPRPERGALAFVTSFSLLPHHLLGLIAPNWQGSIAYNTYHGERYYWEYVLYIGLLPLLLSILGAFTHRGRPWMILALLSLFLALAEGNPLYHLLRFLPGFADFRAHARFIYLFTFAAALLAAYGWEFLSRFRLAQPRRNLLTLIALTAFITLFDLLSFAKTLAPLASPEVYRATPVIVQTIRDDPTWGRAFVIPPIDIFADWSPPEGWAGNPDGWLEARVYLPANVPLSFGLTIVNGYAPLIDPRHANFFGEASRLAFAARDPSLYSLVGVKYFATPPGPSLDLPTIDIPPFHLHLNEKAFPRAFTVNEIISEPTSSAALERTIEIARDGRLDRVAVIRSPVPESLEGRSAAIQKIEELRPEHIVIHAVADGQALVILNERWDPGWTARVDGQTAPLFEANGVLLGVPIMDGEHIVEFLYQPRGFLIGRAVTTLTLLATTLLLGIALLRKRKSK